MPSSPRSAHHRHHVALAAAVALVLALLGPGTGRAASEVTLLPSELSGSVVTITPSVLRAPDGTAELDIGVGGDATSDVVVTMRLAPPDVAADGTVTVGDGTVAGTVSSGSRLRPGEALRVTVTGVTAPTLVVAEVRAPDGAEATAEPVALVLPGAPGDAPQVTLRTVDGAVEAIVTAAAPLVVSARLRGASSTTFPERLVLASGPVVLTAPEARWPLPSEVTVTDETGRTVTATTGATGLALVALALVVAAAAALAVARRRHAVTGG